MDYLSRLDDFNMLSLQDLLAARDLYHEHLYNKKNVVGTAVGRYRIRKTDEWPGGWQQLKAQARTYVSKPKVRRTLENSEVRPYSWPCILVFVEKWVDRSEFNYAGDASETDRVTQADLVPKTLYMPDGSSVPVCIVSLEPEETVRRPIGKLTFPTNVIGGGYPLIMDVQGQERVASLGCLVTDGHLLYALTNRHVTGPAGQPVYTFFGEEKIEIGRSSDKQLTRLKFQEVYEEWPGKKFYLNLDVGLVEISDQRYWTSQIYGIGKMGKLADLSTSNFSLKLIDSPVRAFGCASGEMYGLINALFFRYKSVGGFEYIADFLIGPQENRPLNTQPGDSGTVWMLERNREGEKEAEKLMPIAVQWGGMVDVAGSEGGAVGDQRQPYALATSLSSVCSRLNVDIVRDLNIGFPEYWGAVGHYTIANKAIDFIASPTLKALMQANLDIVTFPVGEINKKRMEELDPENGFIPLADVPDYVWKRSRKGHSWTERKTPEGPNHFADIDQPRGDGKTLLELCKNKPKNVAVPFWLAYYEEVGDKRPGLLPFRVWQFYQEMVQFAKDGDVERFVCAAGILSHYVGDACQPLHVSYLHHGDPEDSEVVMRRNKETGELEPEMVEDEQTGQLVEKTRPRAFDVHQIYEADMVNYHTLEIMQGIDAQLAQAQPLKLVGSGHAAAVATVKLMQNTFSKIEPRDIVTEYTAVLALKPKPRAQALWDKFGPQTISVMSQGSRYLAMLWESAWVKGSGDANIDALGPVSIARMIELYENDSFLRSYELKDIGAVLK